MGEVAGKGVEMTLLSVAFQSPQYVTTSLIHFFLIQTTPLMVLVLRRDICGVLSHYKNDTKHT